MSIGRRVFVKQGALALLAMGLPPEFLLRPLMAGTPGTNRKKTLICIFQRGAVDGLSMVVPHGDGAYYRLRRSIAIPAPKRGDRGSAIDLDGHFGLHPTLAPLHELYGRGEMALVLAVGSPHPTRSHFDAQDFMETGTPGVKSTPDGWLNRILQSTECGPCQGRTLAGGAAHAADHAAGQVAMAGDLRTLRGIAMNAALPRALAGPHPAAAIEDLARFGVADDMAPSFQRLYRTATGDALSSAADEAFEAIRVLEGVDPGAYRPANGASYPNGEFGRSLRQIAQLVKADVGVEIAFADLGGWDTHVGQGAVEGQLAARLGQLAQGLGALYADLGARMEDVVILTMSEFGRTVAENGSGGTDHGHANVMLVMGGSVHGGRILGEWPGLEREQLYEGRDLALTTDFRDVFGEIAERHLGATDLERVFPGFGADRSRWRGVIG